MRKNSRVRMHYCYDDFRYEGIRVTGMVAAGELDLAFVLAGKMLDSSMAR